MPYIGNKTADTTLVQDNSITSAKIQNDAVTKDKVDFVTDSGGASLEAKGSSGYDGAIRLNCSVNSHYTELKSASHGSYSGNLSFTLPSSTGTNGQFLQTNGSGVLSFANAGETNSPYARLGMTTSPSATTGVNQTAAFNNILFASDNSIVDSTAFKITPGVAGKYFIAAQINYAQNSVDQADYGIVIMVDGTEKARKVVWASGTASTYGTDVFVSTTLDLTASNYVQIRVIQNSGGNAQYSYNDSVGLKNWFELFRIATWVH